MEEKKGLWICIEGADYTGKRTQCSLLFDKLTSLSEDNIIVYTHEPTARAKEIKRKLKEEKGEAYKDGLKMAELYIEDRVWNEKNVINPILNAGGIAISNRYKYSTDAYQSLQEIDLETLINAQKKFKIGTPHVTLFLDINEKELVERMKKTDKEPDKFESDLLFQRKVAEKYRAISRISSTDKEYFGDVKLVDANDKPEEVFEKIWQAIGNLYEKWDKYNDLFEYII